MAQRTLDDLDRALAEADRLLSAPDDDLDAMLAEADALLAAPAPRPVSPQAPRRPPPAAPAAPVSPARAAGARPTPAPRAPGLLGVERGGRLTLPGGASPTDLAVIESSPASRSLERPDPFARRPQPLPPNDALGAPDVSLPARVVGGAANLGQNIVEAVPAAGKGLFSGTIGAAASTAGTLASGAFARDAEEARILSVPAATARREFAPSPTYGADVLDEPGVMLDPRFWGYMAGQLTGSVASLAGAGSGGRVVGQVAASKLAQRSPALAAKLAAIGGPGAATAGESLIEAVDAYQTVIGDGKTPDAAAEAAARVFSANAALLGLTNHPLFEAGGRGFRQVLKRALTEGGQEAGQTMAANVATDRPTMEGVGTSALVGAIGGPVAGAILDGPAGAEAPVAPPAPAQATALPIPPPPSVADRIRAAVAASEAARKASSFEATPAAAGAPNADLEVVLAEADAVLQEADAGPGQVPGTTTAASEAPPSTEDIVAPPAAPPPAPPVVDIAPPPAQTVPDVAVGSELGEGTGEGGRVPRRRDADFRPQGRAQRARHLDNVFADILADARELDPDVDDAAVRREFDARVELFEELNAEAREAGADPLDLLREIARLGGIDELDNGKGQHGELKRLREGQGGAVGGIKGVFRRRAYGGNGVPVAGLPLDVMLQQLQQDPRWRNLEDLNDLVEVLDDVQRGNFQRLDLLPGYDRAMRELGMRRGERWWDDPIFPPDAGAVVDETTAEDDLDAAVNEADVVLGETVDDSFDFGDVVEAPPDRQPSAQEMLDDARERIKAGAVVSPEDLQILQDLAAEEADANAGAIDLDTVVAEADTVLADTLDTGEQQTRLPGEVGKVRDEERAQPTEAVPDQSLRLTATEGKATQSGLFGEAPPKPRAPKPRDTSTRDMFGEAPQADDADDVREELREALGVSEAALDRYDPAQAVKKIGRKWYYRTLEGNDSQGSYDTRREALEAAQKHLALKREQFNNPEGYRQIESVRASRRIAIAEGLQRRGMSEMEAYKEAERIDAEQRAERRKQRARNADPDAAAAAEARAHWRTPDGRAHVEAAARKMFREPEGFRDWLLEQDDETVARVWRDGYKVVQHAYNAHLDDDVAPMAAGRAVVNEDADDDIAPMTAYHGSPHVFEKFSLHKIGTGEGAQAYGWGLYFAGAKELATHYRNKLSKVQVFVKGEPLDDDGSYFQIGVRGIADYLQRGTPWDKALADVVDDFGARLNRSQARNRLGADPGAQSRETSLRNAITRLATLDEGDVTWKKGGRLYTVEIPEHDEYLDWDRNLRSQPEAVQNAVFQALELVNVRTVKRNDGAYDVARVRADGSGAKVWDGAAPTADAALTGFRESILDMTGEQLYRELTILAAPDAAKPGWGSIREETAQAASMRLSQAGVPGIRYLDGASRAKGEGSHNYVVFDDSLVEVTDIAEMAKPKPGSASAQIEKLRASQPPKHNKGRGGGLAMTHQRKPGTKTLAETPKTARPSDIVRKMSELLKTPVGSGRLITRGALGYYHRAQNAIRVKVANDLPVLMHEFGHAAERHFALNWKDPRWNGELLQVGAPTSLPHYTLKQRRAEGVAEFWRLWVMAPAQAQAQAPNFYRAVEDRLEALGDLGKGLRALRADMQAFLDADPQARVHLRIDFDGAKASPDAGTWVAKAATRWVDDLYTLQKATEAMAGGAPLPPTLNAYMLARNARGAMNRAADFLEHGVRDVNGQFIGPSLRAALQPVHDKLGEFAVYLVALRAKELHRRNIQTGLTDVEVNQTVAQIEAGPNAAAFIKARDGVYEFQTAMLTYAREAGVLSAGQQAAIQRLNQYYVPFQRMIDAEVGQGTGRRIADRLSPVKKIKGSGRDIINPLESIIKNAFTFVDTVEKNRAMQALTALADKADERKRPGSGSGQWLRKIKDPQTVTGVKLGDVLKEAAQKAGQTWMNQRGEQTLPPELEQMLEDLNIDLDQVLPVFQTAFSGPKGEQIVTVLRDGKRAFYEIENPMLYQAITMISPVARDGDLKLAEFMASLLRSGATLTLGFITRNPGRDTLTAFLQSRHGFIPVADTLRGAVKVLFHELGIREDEEVAQFWAQGITQATLVGQDRDMLRKKLRQLSEPELLHHVRTVVRNPLELLQALSAFSEVSTRMGEFSLALRQGGTPHTVWQRLTDRSRATIDENTLAIATLAARDVTTDFSRGGSKAKEWNQTRAFFNARVQGYARIYDTVRNQPGTVALNVSALAAAAVVLKMLAYDDDDYRELAEWEKLTYWHYRPRWGTWRADSFIRIPKPFEWAFIPNAVEAAIDYAADRKPEAFNLLKAQIKENARTLVVGAVPTWIMPAVEAQANYSFFRQAPIVSPWDTDLPLEQQYSDWTSQTARGLAKLGLPLAPAQIDHLLYGYTAGLGRAAVTGVVDPALRKLGLAPPAATAPAPRWEDTPAIGSLIRSAAPRSDAESIREFYESYREMTGTQRGYNKAKADPDQQARILDGVRGQRWRGREKEMKAAKKRIDAIADEIEKVYADGTMTPKEKTTSLEGMRRALVYEARVGLGYESTDHVRRRTAR